MNPAAAPNPILRFAAVSYRYERANGRALHDFSLDIPPGSITAILGPNGAGKSTLLHLALGLLAPESGGVTLLGRPLPSYGRRELGRLLALVPQTEHVPFDYTILEYVLLGRAPYLQPLEMPGPADVARAEAALEQVGLRAYAGRSLTRLSGGERQLVLVARALAQQPRLLLLDEPTSHLDLSNKARLMGLLVGLAAAGVTIIFTTHEPETAAAAATHVALMRQGAVTFAGSRAEALTGPRLSHIYAAPIEVIEVAGRRVTLWNPLPPIPPPPGD